MPVSTVWCSQSRRVRRASWASMAAAACRIHAARSACVAQYHSSASRCPRCHGCPRRLQVAALALPAAARPVPAQRQASPADSSLTRLQHHAAGPRCVTVRLAAGEIRGSPAVCDQIRRRGRTDRRQARVALVPAVQQRVECKSVPQFLKIRTSPSDSSSRWSVHHCCSPTSFTSA